MNRDAQKKYANTSHIAQWVQLHVLTKLNIDPAALDKRIQERSQYHKANQPLRVVNLWRSTKA